MEIIMDALMETNWLTVHQVEIFHLLLSYVKGVEGRGERGEEGEMMR